MRKTRESEFQKGILNHSKRRRSSSAVGEEKSRNQKPNSLFIAIGGYHGVFCRILE